MGDFDKTLGVCLLDPCYLKYSDASKLLGPVLIGIFCEMASSAETDCQVADVLDEVNTYLYGFVMFQFASYQNISKLLLILDTRSKQFNRHFM
jgi:hypothetical protein